VPTLAALAALGVLAVLVVLPLAIMALASLRPAGVFPLEAGALTLAGYAEVFGQPGTLLMLRNTAIYAPGALVIALPLAFGLAFLTERTDVPGRGLLYTLMFVPMSIPTFAAALGWVLLLGPRAGTLNVWLRYLLGLDLREGPFNIFSLGGMIFVHALGIVPSMWLVLISVLRNLDPHLEEAAATTGASRWRTLRYVVAPLMAPGILSVLVLFTIVGIDSLETPLALGKTAGIDVLATRVYDLIHLSTDRGFNYGPPAALGMFSLALGLGGIWLYLRLTRGAYRYTVVTGKAYRPRPVRLGRWRYAALAAVGLFLLIDVVIPLLVLVTTSFQRFYQPLVPGVQTAWTLNNYQQLLDYRFFGQYFVNTVLVAVAAATVTMLLVSFFAWQMVRWPSRLTRLVGVLTFLPLAVPGAISGLAFLLLFIGTPLYGTLALLVLAFTARFVAYGTRLMHAAQLQVHKELEEAALAGGVGYFGAFFLINLRLLLPAVLNGWLWILTHAARDFTTPLMVASAGSLLAGNVIFGRYADGSYPVSAAMMVGLVAFNVAAVALGRRWLVRAVS
jgi:iron(III) transport system permease protein